MGTPHDCDRFLRGEATFLGHEPRIVVVLPFPLAVRRYHDVDAVVIGVVVPAPRRVHVLHNRRFKVDLPVREQPGAVEELPCAIGIVGAMNLQDDRASPTGVIAPRMQSRVWVEGERGTRLKQDSQRDGRVINYEHRVLQPKTPV